MGGFLFQAFVYLTAAVIAVPIAKRFGHGSVLGYLIAGIIIGPIIGLVGTETQDLQHFAEFGVVMMLFLVGLEVEPRLLWEMRSKLLGLGGLQVGLTTAIISAAALFFGLAWQTSLAIGLIGSLSSTAIALQTLNEKGLIKSEGGQGSFSILLFQDIAVIPMLALIPLLSIAEFMSPSGADAVETSHNLLTDLPNWAAALATLGAIAAVIFGGHFLARPLFRFIAESRLREIFTAAALFFVIAIALLMELVGLSPALGTFLAGVVLANNEYKHELESDIAPFKGLLLGLFFITVGASINLDLLVDEFNMIISITAAILIAKLVILYSIARIMKIPAAGCWLIALGLSQVGEFGFVLINFSMQNNAINMVLANIFSLVVALSMLVTPFLFILYDKLIAGRPANTDGRAADDIDDAGCVIVAGHGRFGQVVNRMLISSGYKTVVLDHKSSLVDGMRQFGVSTYYGDASRPDLLHSAGLKEANAIVIAIDDQDRAIEMVHFVRRERPDIHIVARAVDRHHVYELYQAGANDIVRETFDSAVRAGKYTLEAISGNAKKAEEISTLFVAHDRKVLVKLAQVYDPKIEVYKNDEYKKVATEHNELLRDAINAMGSQAKENE